MEKKKKHRQRVLFCYCGGAEGRTFVGDNLSKISSLKNVTTNGVPAKNKTVLRRIIDNGLQNVDMILSKKKKKIKNAEENVRNTI